MAPVQAAPVRAAPVQAVPVQAAPQATVETYWKLVADGRYDEAWLYLSESFRAVRHDGNFAGYHDFWQGKRVCGIQMTETALTDEHTCTANVTFHLEIRAGIDCKPHKTVWKIKLVRGSADQPWKINDSDVKEEPAQPDEGNAPRLKRAVEKALVGQALGREDVLGLDPGSLSILRNAPYARHGRIFVRDDLTRYYYEGDPLSLPKNGSFDENVLDRTDWSNIRTVKAQQESVP